MAQWLGLGVPSAEALGSIPGRGTRSPMWQLRDCLLQLKKQTKQDTKKLVYKTEDDSDIENKFVVTKGKRGIRQG